MLSQLAWNESASGCHLGGLLTDFFFFSFFLTFSFLGKGKVNQIFILHNYI